MCENLTPDNKPVVPEIVESIDVQEPDAGSTQRQDPPIPQSRTESRRWWLKLMIQPTLLIVSGAIVIAGLGLAQKYEWISAGTLSASAPSAAGEEVSYICPMMCTPPSSEPGRCPVCAMELVPATSNSGSDNKDSVEIAPAARRVANIQTVDVKTAAISRKIRAVGEITFDESTLKTIAAYVDGRIEKLYADFTGVEVANGDHLALIYSPGLYSAQVELLLAKKAMENSKDSTLLRVSQSNQELYESAKQRLIEMGLTDNQIQSLEQDEKASSRLKVCAPNQGTVIEKLAVEGQYVTEGQPIYRLADLSTVWLMLELFPEDAADVHYGQKVEAIVQSMPSRTFTGRVAFVDPQVDPKTRTVGIRVVFPNPDRRLRIGDYTKASIRVPVSTKGVESDEFYDSELANRWISPRYPHVISDEPGVCPLSGLDLVRTSTYGYRDSPASQEETCTVPRNAVLMAAERSIVYVETKPGRFEIRDVTLGPSVDGQIVVFSGLQRGDKVATDGNFLIDSQMQLAGNPSLIDPTRIKKSEGVIFTEEMLAAIAKLPAEEQAQAKMQQICPVTEMPLGSMGKPVKIDLDGETVFLCCQGCEGSLRREPDVYMANLKQSRGEVAIDPEIQKALDQLPPDDRQIAMQQKTCPVADYPLGAMGVPIKVDVQGTPVFICCEGCRSRLLASPKEYLDKLKASVGESAPSDIAPPPTGVMEIVDAPGLAPQIGEIELIVDDTNESDSSAPHSASRHQLDQEEQR
ncbi:MAG: hypothetical protein CMK32_06730 [Porticoccaceae bacterium]|nr:hypothetical protein [Porticoccaceae bacterium]